MAGRKKQDQSTRRRRPVIRGVVVFLVVLFLTAGLSLLLADRHVASIGRAKVLEFDRLADQKPFDCVIVPGALVLDNSQPSAMLRARLDMAIKIYNSGATDRILVSGDHGKKDYDEVGVMADYLVAAGIPDAHVFMDHAGFDTYNTVYRAQSIFCVRRALITTQDFHLLRALYIGEQLGVDLWGIDSEYGYAAKKQYYRLREYPARLKAFLECQIFRTKPVFGGPTLPIDGDGTLTRD